MNTALSHQLSAISVPEATSLVFATAALLMGGLAVLLLWLARRNDPDDRASGTLIGQASDQQSAEGAGVPASRPTAVPWTPDTVLIRRCGWCRTQQGEEPVLLMPGTAFEVTDGICPACEAIHFPKVVASEWGQANARPATLQGA